LREDKSDYAARLKAFRDLLDGTANVKVTFVFASHDHRLYVYDKGSLSRSVPATKPPPFVVTGGAGAPKSWGHIWKFYFRGSSDEASSSLKSNFQM
jgi:hypothetical protein